MQQVHAEQQAHSQLNLPFYFTNQVFGSGLWDNLPTSGHRLDKLKQWLGVFNSTGAIPVFVPQWYPWVYKPNDPSGKRTEWTKHDDRDPWLWWDIALDELLNLKNTYCCTLRVQPILQASAWAEPSGSSVGPGHIDMHNQLRSILKCLKTRTVSLQWGLNGRSRCPVMSHGMASDDEIVTGEQEEDAQRNPESLRPTEAPVSASLMERVLERDNLVQAYRQVLRNRGSAGIDGMTVEQLPSYLKQHWSEVKDALLCGRYQPQPVLRVEIPKPGSGVRKLGVLLLLAFALD